MTFDQLKYFLLLEYQFEYSILNTDKEQLIYDFYLLTLIDKIGQNPKAEGAEYLRYREDEEDVNLAVKETKEKLLRFLKSELLGAVLYSLVCEFRHIYDKTYDGENSKDIDYYFKKIKQYNWYKKFEDLYNSKKVSTSSDMAGKASDMHRNRQAAYEAVRESGISFEKFVKICKRVFNDLEWYEGYGGKAWSKITDAWLKLYKAENLDDISVWIDHIYDLQHNTGTVFNKLKAYYKDGYEWILKALNFKANARTPWAIWGHSSSSMKDLAGRVLHNYGWGAAEDYFKKKEEISKEFEKEIIPNSEGVDFYYIVNSENGEYLLNDGKFGWAPVIKLENDVMRFDDYDEAVDTFAAMELDPKIFKIKEFKYKSTVDDSLKTTFQK